MVIESLGFHRSCIYDWLIEGQGSGRTVVEDKQTLRRLVRGALRRLQCSADKLKRLIHESNVAYTLG